MEYQSFLNDIRIKILENKNWNILEEGYKLYRDGATADNEEEQVFIRNTNIKYHQIESDILIGDFIELKIAASDSNNTFCRFSVNYLYDEYLTGGWERIEYIISENLKIATITDIDEIVNNITDYSFIHERLIIRPINYTDNRFELKNCIYKQIGDIALVLYIFVYDNETMGLGTMKVQTPVFNMWGKELSEVWQEALINTNVMAQPRMYMNNNDTINPSFEKGAFMAINSTMKIESKLFAPVVTTTKQKNGAIAMFYPGVQERIAEMCGGSYYVIFTSIDDVRIHPYGTSSPRSMLQSLKGVNKSFNRPEDILSRKVFFYDHEKHSLDVVEL